MNNMHYHRVSYPDFIIEYYVYVEKKDNILDKYVY